MNDEIPMDAPLWRCVLKKNVNTVTKIGKRIAYPLGILGFVALVIYATWMCYPLILTVWGEVVSVLIIIHPLVYVGLLAIIVLTAHSTYWCIVRKMDYVDWSSSSAENASVLIRIILFVIIIVLGLLGAIWSLSPGPIRGTDTGFCVFMFSCIVLIMSVFPLMIDNDNHVLRFIGAYIYYKNRIKSIK